MTSVTVFSTKYHVSLYLCVCFSAPVVSHCPESHSETDERSVLGLFIQTKERNVNPQSVCACVLVSVLCVHVVLLCCCVVALCSTVELDTVSSNR